MTSLSEEPSEICEANIWNQYLQSIAQTLMGLLRHFLLNEGKNKRRAVETISGLPSSECFPFQTKSRIDSQTFRGGQLTHCTLNTNTSRNRPASCLLSVPGPTDLLFLYDVLTLTA
jgi:hypothetical protein